MRTPVLGPGPGAVLVVATVASLATACSPPAGTGAAERTARDALHAASAHDTATLCALLTPATAHALEKQESAPCPTAARSLDLGQPSAGGPTQVWGDEALVPMGPATVFLDEVDGRWRVRAAGCSLREDQPADCRLGGG
jgi:hypothetical protein